MTYELKNGFTIVVGDDAKAIDALPLELHVKPSAGIPLMFEIYHHSKYSKLMSAVFSMVKHNINLPDYKVWLYVTSLEVLETYVEEYNKLDFQLDTRVVRFTSGKAPVEIDIDNACRLINDRRPIR